MIFYCFTLCHCRKQDETSSKLFVGPNHSVNGTQRTTAVTHSLKITKDLFENQVKPKFTSHFSLKPNSKADLNEAETNLHKKENHWTQRLHGLYQVRREDNIYQVHGHNTSAVDTRFSQNCNSIHTSRTELQDFSNGRCGLHQNHVQISQSGLLPPRTELNLDNTKYQDFSRLNKVSRQSTMLSSTVVTVMAPQWSGRPRKNKKEGSGSMDFQGNLQGGTNSSSSVERTLRSGLQSQQHTPFVRSNTVGWSTRSGPIILDAESQRKVLQSASLDVNSMRMDDKRIDRPMPSPLSPLSPVSPMSIDSNEPQRGHSPLSSKPTTSSMLLSLRRGNSNTRTPNESQSPDNLEVNRQFSTHLTQAFQPKNELSPTPISNNNAPLSPTPTYRERGISKTYNFSTVPNKHSESPYSQTNPESVSPQRSYSREHSDSIKLTKKQVTLPKRTPYDHTALLKTHSTPRRTPLSSISWMPQDNQEGSSQISANDTPITTPFNTNNNNSPTDNRGFIGQIPNCRENNNIAESGGKSNVNLVVKVQGGTQNSPSHQSLLKGQPCSSREAPKPISLLAASSNSKFSTAPHTPLSHTKGLTYHDANSFTAKVTEFPPTPSLSPKSPYSPPTDNSCKFQNMYCTSKSNNSSSMAQNKDRFTKQSHLHDITNTVTNVATKPSLDLGQSSKTFFQPSGVSSQGNVCGSTQSNSFEQSSKFNNATPLGFERTYAPKPYQAKTNLNPTVSLYSKSNYSPTFTNSTASNTSFLSPHSPPVTVSSLLTPPTTPNYAGPSSPESSSPKNGRSFTSSSETKLQAKGEFKKARRVTFEDTVDSKPEEKQDTVSARNIKAPSIFSFLRSGNPTQNAAPRFSPTPKCSNIQAGGKYRSLSSDSADFKARETYKQLSTETFDHTKKDLNMPRQERTLSAESGSSHYRSAAALSLPPDFANGYKNRYSSPPYSTLVSTRTAQGETKPQRLPLFQRHSQPNVPNVDKTPISKPTLLPSSSLQLRTVPLQIDLQEKSKDVHLDQVNNNPSKNIGEVFANGHVQLVDNRVHISSQSLPGDKLLRSASTCVTETLVYSIRAKADADGFKNTTPKNTANTAVTKDLSQQWQVQRKEPLKEPDNQSNQSWSGSSTTENNDDENAKRKIKEVGKSKFYSIEGSIEQSPKRSRFALKKSSSASNATGLSRSESGKSNNKMDQVLSKIKQTFSTKKSVNEDDSKKWKKSGQAPSLSGMSDSSTSDVTIESNRMLEGEEVMELNNNDKGMEDKHRWANNRYTLVTVEKNKMADDKFWMDEVMADAEIEGAFTQELPDNGNNIHVKIHSPAQDFDHEIFDFKPTNQLPSPNNLSPSFSPNGSCAFPSTQFRKSASSPRSPFSPFGSLSPLSPFPAPDTLDDSVFYSPKPPRHRDSSSSPCELGEISLVASRRSRASTGPPSAGPVTNEERMSTSYADLKYGIEPGRSFSVSSVSSSRPSGPGRISTGSRFMSVGDLTKPMAFSCGHTASDVENWSGQYGCQSHFDDSQDTRFPSDSGKMRSRSLPRSFTQNWGQSLSLSSNPTWSPSVNDFPRDVEGPPTPPPTPPLSPVNRRMSKAPCQSPPGFSGSPDPPQDSQASRGHLPSRGYMTSLSTFEESSDSSSDTTTDDEYYLETGEDEEKETEL